MSQQAGVEGTVSQGQNNDGQQQQNSGTGSQGQETQQQQQQVQQQQNAAPYAPYLERVPESVRGVIEPIFKEWDAGVQQRFERLHSQMSWAEPWQEIAQQYEPDTVSQAINVLSALEQNPQGFYEAIAQAYGFNQQQAQQIAQQGTLESGEENNDPRLQGLEEKLNSIAEFLVSQQQETQQSQEEKEFFQELQRLKEQHGDFDEDYVITKIANGLDPEQAVLKYRELVTGQAQQLMAPGQQAPVVMSSGGGVPSQSIDFKNLDRKGTQGLVAAALAAQRQQGG